MLRLLTITSLLLIGTIASAGSALQEALAAKFAAANLPIIGMNLPSETDKVGWRFDWDGTPTAAQRTSAQNIVNAFDIAAEVTAASEAKALLSPQIVAQGLIDVLVAKGVCTRAEAKAAIKARWDASQ